AVDDVEGAVAVLKHELVDWLRPVVKPVNQRLAQVVLERPGWPAGAGDADAAYLPVVLDVVSTEEQVVPPILLYDGRCPQSALRPRDVGHVQHTRVLGPSDQIPG